ncbi:MAG TPA: CHAT domain-containing protein [Gemmatimonadales bacterium]|nr:CHAT domain-containing protein [Gemmatimonadales bacterium]
MGRAQRQFVLTFPSLAAPSGRRYVSAMLLRSLVTLLGLLAQQERPLPSSPWQLLREIQDAVEGDSAAPLRDRLVAAGSPYERMALLGRGSIAALTYEYDRADSLLARAVALDADDLVADLALMESGASLAVRARFADAADAYARALAGAERRGDSVLMAAALLGLAGPRARLAPAEYPGLLDRAARLTGGNPYLEASLSCQRAVLLARRGDPSGLPLAAQGAQVAWSVRDTRQEARCWHAMAQAYIARGNMEGADTTLARAATLYRRARDGAGTASVLQWRGYFYILLNRFGEARLRIDRALSEGERTGAMSVVGYALLNLGTILLAGGDRVAAGEQFGRASALFSEQGDTGSLITARNMWGNLARAAGDVRTAREQYALVLAWADREGNRQSQLGMHQRLGTLAHMEGDWQEAEREYGTALALARANAMTGWEASLRYDLGRLALARGDLPAAQRELGSFVAGLSPDQHLLRYETRAMLAEAHTRSGNLARGEAELVAAVDELDGWRASLSERAMRARALESDAGVDPDLGVATVIAALARAGNVASAFRLAERRRARELTDQLYRAQAAQPGAATGTRRLGPTAVVADPVQLLPDSQAALLQYVTGRGGEPTTLFVATGAGLAARELPPIDSLQADLRRFATVIEGGGDARPLGRSLGAALLQPAVEALGSRVTRLVIVPDDILARVPFDALVLDDGRYAVERFAIGLVPSASTLAALRARAGGEGPVRILAIGDPEFAESPDHAENLDPATPVFRSAFDAGGGLPRLRASAGEARRVARYGEAAELRLGSEASEAYLRAAPLDSFRILHFATHALVNEETMTRTALALAPGEGEDGFLGAGDIVALNLAADLVVLSACRTAGGVVLAGEGIQGLTAPLLQAGARSVVATGWRIADQRAASLVDGFYRALASGNPVGDALRSAKVAAMRSGAPPAEWAAFVAVGDPMVRIPLVPPSARRLVWTAAAGTALTLALLYGWTRKRRVAAAVRVPFSNTARTDQT